MKINKVTAVVFSPTAGTKKYVVAVGTELGMPWRMIDLTQPENRKRELVFGSDDLVIFGAPVYYGRLPKVDGGLFANVRGNNTPAIFNVSYGNRDYDDALLEEKEILEAGGFKGIAAAAWVAPHSFSEKIAAGRPDEDDKEAVSRFGQTVKELLAKDTIGPLRVPGNRPYHDFQPLTLYPTGNDNCVDCRTCVSLCPTDAIDDSEPTKTEANKCILCMACVRQCPWEARNVWSEDFTAIAGKLESALLIARKEPEVFFAGAN
ncbi:MAG: 4Fe-4S binding protein [Bacillota bacterium]|nr:4Fe-4S binding protein [Bacillota bacterium]